MGRVVWNRLLCSQPFSTRRTPITSQRLSARTVFTMNGRTYADAIASLNTLQSNFAIVDAIRKSGRKMNEQAIPEMVEWCRKIGYQPSDINILSPIHIAGTKGKGSTASFISSVLTQYIGSTTKDESRTMKKVGLYTSPHLRFVRERIQINGQPLTEDQFTRYFFETWDRLEASAAKEGSVDPKSTASKPVYFRFLTLMAFHTYISEGVDVAVVECGIGGAYDSTNVIEKPTVTGITNLGIDHVGVLGATLGEIAWHKAGIMKKGSKCFTTSTQKEEAKKALGKVAAEKGVELVYTDTEEAIQSGKVKIGLQADFQKINASLAKKIAEDWLSSSGFELDESKILQGLEKTKWAGRCETRTEKGITWCIDGGHTLDSIEVAGRWFGTVLNTQPRTKKRFLIFNQQTRDSNALATALHSTLANAIKDEQPFTHAIFCTNTTYRETGFRPDLVSVNINASDVEELTVQKQLAKTWASIDPTTDVEVVRTIEEAVELVRKQASEGTPKGENVIALVTGSLHLVGGFLEVLEGKADSIPG